MVEKPLSRLILHAPGIHQGGGLRLLQLLLLKSQKEFDFLQLDSRSASTIAVTDHSKVRWINKSISARLCAEWRLFLECKPEDYVLCFQGLPPLFPVKGNVVVFAQNHLLFSQAPLDQYSWPIRARLHVERLWMKLFGAGVARFIVQSRTMATLVCRQFPSQNPILILPLYGDIGVPCSRAQSREKQFDFIYVADGEPHKNHRNLIEAWCLLASEEIRPSLALTIDPSRYAPLCAFIQERCTAHDLNITNLGVVTPQEILARYLASSALVFPSNFESFGLPLIEASQVGLPIIAGERDFVRDVCSPVHTFDPESPVSICRAIRRFLDVPEKPAGLCSAEGFIAKVRGI